MHVAMNLCGACARGDMVSAHFQYLTYHIRFKELAGIKSMGAFTPVVGSFSPDLGKNI